VLRIGVALIEVKTRNQKPKPKPDRFLIDFRRDCRLGGIAGRDAMQLIFKEEACSDGSQSSAD
jgi:hypothetical protein